MNRVFVSLLFVIGACGGQQADPNRSAAPAAASQPAPATHGEGLTLEEAKAVVAEFEANSDTVAPDDPLLQPKTLDDVLEILKRDQMALFGAGVAFTTGMDDAKARALHAQIELAWGDANVVLADILWENAARLRHTKRRLDVKAATGGLAATDQKMLDLTKVLIEKETSIAAALMRVAAVHFATGSEVARKVIESMPEDYVGYRVAADFYRLSQDWERFAGMVSKIEATNPESNGLAFLRGVAAADRDSDRKKAAEYLRTALARDPKFTRAQAQLVLWAGSVAEQHQALVKLEALNPNHQIVVWAGDRIRRAYEKSTERKGQP